MPTTKLGLPTISGNMSADVVRDVNALAEAIDSKTGVPNGLARLDSNGNVEGVDLSTLATKQDLGNKSTLLTTNKTNVVSAVNELFTNVSNGKELVGGAITDVDQNVVIPTNPTFQNLANAIGQISTGKKFATGTMTSSNNYAQFNFSELDSNVAGQGGEFFIQMVGLDFQPSLILAFSISGAHRDLTIFYEGFQQYYEGHNIRNMFEVDTAYSAKDGQPVNGFILPVYYDDEEFKWVAFG